MCELALATCIDVEVLEQNQSDDAQRMHCRTAFFLKKNAACRICSGYTYSDFALGHPLLPGDQCVGNDVALNRSTAFYDVSGSNMAGKSTFLRASD